MSCHTWFSRPITLKEFELIKEYAPVEIYNLVGDSKKNIEFGMYDKGLYDLLMKSYKEDIPCIYGKFWWQLGYGSGNPKLPDSYIHEVKGENGLFVDVEKFHDTFRVKNYSSKVIHNRKELRSWMGKKYFELEKFQLETISDFFRENSGGVITFG